jgi:hypothetical protein
MIRMQIHVENFMGFKSRHIKSKILEALCPDGDAFAGLERPVALENPYLSLLIGAEVE